MSTGSISTNDQIVQSGSSSASDQLSAATQGANGRPTAPGADPRLTAAVDDTGTQNKKAADKAGDGIDKTKKDSQGKTDIDKGGADKMNGIASAMLGALGGGVSSLLGGGSGGGGSGGGMPSMPQVPASSAGQSNPLALSNPKAAQAMSKLLGGDGSGTMGSGGLTSTAGAGRGGGSGTSGPTTPGSTEYEQRVIDLSKQVVDAGIPYAWGGGTVDGPGQGTRDGGVADAAGDYNKSGFDCSGLARYLVYQASGVEIPRTSGDQYAAGQLVSAADARPGDLAFNSNPSEHVMVYVGDGKVCEAQQSGTNVMFSDAASRHVQSYVRVVNSS